MNKKAYREGDIVITRTEGICTILKDTAFSLVHDDIYNTVSDDGYSFYIHKNNITGYVETNAPPESLILRLRNEL